MNSKKKSKRGDNETVKRDFDKTKDYTITVLASVSILLLAAVIALSVYPENKPESESLVSEHEATEVAATACDEAKRQLRYWSVCIVKWHDMGHLRTMDRTFERLQYKFVNASHGDDWDILWAIEQPFSRDDKEEDLTLFAGFADKKMREDQKVNHFPGMGPLVSKSYMNEINAHLPYILPSFVLPDDIKLLDEFIEKNPKAKLVEKNFYNRGVQIINRDEVLETKSEYFYQQFMDNHLLIDGHAFDMGIFVLITSFDPIRLYRYDADVLFRFCAKEYHPFDPEDLDRYVVRKGCHNAYDMPSFENIYTRYGYPFVKIFNMLMEEKGHDMGKFWEKIDDAISRIVINTESYVLKSLRKWNASSHNSFELVRFDFLVDNDMNPFVMEVNMSPNLTPAHKRYEENCNMYEPMIYNVVQMIGGGSYHDFFARFNDTDIIIANRKNIAVGLETCLKNDCHRDCSKIECNICLPCVDASNRYQMREAFRENSYLNNFKRIFPTIQHFYNTKLIDSMTENNKISIEWFRAKCESDPMWC